MQALPVLTEMEHAGMEAVFSAQILAQEENHAHIAEQAWDNQRPQGVGPSPLGKHHILGNHHHGKGNHHGGQQPQEDFILALKAQLAEGEGRQRGGESAH